MEGAQRELQEEAGIRMIDPKEFGVIFYKYEGMEKELKVHLYVAEGYAGNPTESEEMRPQWFAPHEIPYDQMWADDIHWYDYLLKRQPINARFHFENDMATIRDFQVDPINPNN